MNQRTCNIIMACKGHCELPGGKDTDALTAVAAYMSHECACPQEDYKGGLMELIMKEAMFDFMSTATNPGYELRRLFDPWYTKEPTICERIASMFSLTQVLENGNQYVNGFTKELLDQSEIDLGARPGIATGLSKGENKKNN